MCDQIKEALQAAKDVDHALGICLTHAALFKFTCGCSKELSELVDAMVAARWQLMSSRRAVETVN